MTLIFSPGPVHLKTTIETDFTHRGKRMQELLARVKEKLYKKFKISRDYEIVFSGGSSTSALEMVMSSLHYNYSVLGKGEFTNRLKNMASWYSDTQRKKCAIFCQFETSRSAHQDFKIDGLRKKFDRVIVDSVSAFGYYPFPKADIVIASSAKILGGLPVIGIIFIRKEIYGEITEEKGYYLNLKRHWDYSRKNQTPHTSLIPQLLSLGEALRKPLQNINKICKILEGIKFERVGDKVCPVLTFKCKDVSALIRGLEKYKIEIYHNKYLGNNFQIACFSERNESAYKYLVKILNKIKEEKNL